MALVQVKALQPIDLTRMLWGFARLEHHPGMPLLQNAASQLCEVLPACPAPLLRRLMWSFQRFQGMGFRDAALVVAFARELPRAQDRDQASECAW